METVYISIGSNLGKRSENVEEAAARLSGTPGVEVIRLSSLCETEPWGFAAQPGFINAVAEAASRLGPGELLERLKAIEREMGRPVKDERDMSPGVRWGPRIVDLDILFYGQRVIEEEGLTIPHPLAHLRPFALAPLCEIAPELLHPVLRVKVSEIYSSLSDADRGTVKRLERVKAE